jgi:hypothetical protein
LPTELGKERAVGTGDPEIPGVETGRKSPRKPEKFALSFVTVTTFEVAVGDAAPEELGGGLASRRQRENGKNCSPWNFHPASP